MNLLRLPIKVITRLLQAFRSAKEDRLARECLGLPAGHSEYDLHLAYRLLFQEHHPRFKGASCKMDEINKAFDHLKKKFPGTHKRSS